MFFKIEKEMDFLDFDVENYFHSFFVLIKTKSAGVVHNKKILIKI